MAASAVARETICALRRDIARIEGRLAERLDMPAGARAGTDDAGIVLRRDGAAAPGAGLLPTGAARLDAALGGGLPAAALTEIHGRQTREAAAVAGFALALAARSKAVTAERPLLWITAGGMAAEAGKPYAPGVLQRFSVPAEALLVAAPRRLEDALWVAEEAAALAVLSAVILELRGAQRRLDLTATRRLHRRARTAGRPVYLLRHAGLPEPTAAPVRLVVAPAPAGERATLSGPLAGSIGPPAFAVTVARSPAAIVATMVLEWMSDECAFRERASVLRDVAATPDPGAVVPLSGDGADPAGEMGPRLALSRRDLRKSA